MTQLKSFNANTANPHKDDSGFNAQLPSTPKDKDDIENGSVEAATQDGSSNFSFLPVSKVGRAILVLAVVVLCGNGIVRYNSDGAPASASAVGHSRALSLFDANIGGKNKKDKKEKKQKENAPSSV